jgi:hypothetical protein
VPRSKAHAAPDGAWLFGGITWITWEAKSEAKPDGELGAGDTREAGGHLRYVSRTRGEEVRTDSFGFIIAPQERIHPAAATGLKTTSGLPAQSKSSTCYRASPEHGDDCAAIMGLTPRSRLKILRTEQALPTQWMPHLRTSLIADLREATPVDGT